MIDIDRLLSKRRKMSNDSGSTSIELEQKMLTTRSGYVVKCGELCRVIMQAFHDLKLNETCKFLEKEADISFLGSSTIQLSEMIDSEDWEGLISNFLPSQSWPSCDIFEKAKNAVFCLKTLELCLNGDYQKVLNCIRTSPQPLHGPLASLLLFTKETEIRNRYIKLFGDEFSTRISLKKYIQSLSSADDCLDSSRLLSIIDSAYSNPNENLPKTLYFFSSPSRSDREHVSEFEGKVLTPGKRSVNFTELIRLIYFALLDFEYVQSAKSLLDESLVQFDFEIGQDMEKNVLCGRWNAVLADIARQYWRNSDDQLSVRTAVLKQYFLEMCESGNFQQALECLRHDESKSLTYLSRFFMFKDPEQLREAARFDGAQGRSRYELLEFLQQSFQREHGSHSVQLMTVLDFAIDFDVKHCNFHNVPKSSPHSLLRWHSCRDINFPNCCLQTLCGHTDEVWFIAFSEDGSRLASASKDATVRIWEMKQSPDAHWYQLHAFHINAKHVSYLCWSTDGTYLVTCASKKRVFVFDVTTGTKVSTLRGHKDQVLACVWINTTARIATGSVDHQIIIWSLSGEPLCNWRTQNAVHNLCVSRDQKYLFANAAQYSVQIYDLDRMELISEFREESQQITSLAMSSVEPLILVTVVRPAAIHMWKIDDIKNPTLIREFVGAVQDKFIVRCAFGGFEDHFVVSGSEDCNVIIWSRHTGEQLGTLSGHQGSVNSVSWSPRNANIFASASDDHTIRIWASESFIKRRQSEKATPSQDPITMMP